MSEIFTKFKEQARAQFHLPEAPLERLTPQLISPFTLKLPTHVLNSARAIVSDLYRLSNSPFYQSELLKLFPFKNHFQKIPSLLSSLDVHLTPQGELKIIEVNTNASSFLMNLANYAAKSVSTFPSARADIVAAFRQTFPNLKPGDLLLVMDENPEQQNMWAEFQMYKSLLEDELSVTCAIADPQDLTVDGDGQISFEERPVAAIYNRFCDFYLETNSSLAKAFQCEKTRISPHPWGYALLADKTRFLMWDKNFFEQLATREGLRLPHLQSALLEVKKFSDFADADELWSRRGRYFFKPPNSYGGKSVYKGKSISRSTFQRIYNDDYLAQEAAPAPEITLNHEGADHTFKYDLRFYFFADHVQLAVARLYQGQLTNLQTQFGGLTPIEFVDTPR